MDEKTITSESPIDGFRDEHAFLSNFYAHPIEIEGAVYPTAEHAFQALKTEDPAERERVRTAATPKSAKVLGRRVKLRPDWDTVRLSVMEQVVRAKFADPEMADLLLGTGHRKLIEGNTWRDRFWGCTQNKDGQWQGENHLGKILMKVRDELRAGTRTQPEQRS